MREADDDEEETPFMRTYLELERLRYKFGNRNINILWVDGICH